METDSTPTIAAPLPPRRRLRRALALLTAAIAVVGGTILTAPAPPAEADSCYTWQRTLSAGDSGADVRELQIRVAGWSGYRTNLAIDGSFGPATTTAVRNFQQAYGLQVDGIFGPATRSKIYSLQDADCSPAHFSWSEVDGGCGRGGFAGGSVSAATVRQNLLRAMWRAEAIRHRLGDRPLTVTSGFRSQACDRQVGGSGSGQHTYGKALDLVGGGGQSLCQIALAARYTSNTVILGPGYPNHHDHIHVDNGGSYWSAPSCGI